MVRVCSPSRILAVHRALSMDAPGSGSDEAVFAAALMLPPQPAQIPMPRIPRDVLNMGSHYH